MTLYVDEMAKEDYTVLKEYITAISLWKYMPPFLFIIGLVGNVLVFIVLSKSSMKKTTTSLYLRFLAVFDMLVLCTGLLRYWIIYLAKYDIRKYSPAVCKIHTWAVYSTTYISAWLLVSVTLERCFSVWFPHRVKVTCTKRVTYIIIACIIVFMSLLNAHYLYGLGDYVITEANETDIIPCDAIYDGYFKFEKNIWPWVDLCIYSVIPSSILTVCNISIIYRVVSSSRHILQNDSSNTIQNRHLSSRRSQASSLTAMLVVTSATYVICTTPFCIYTIYSNVFNFSEVESAREQAIGALVWSLVNMLQYTNNCINFVLYCVCGQRFRHELHGLLCCAKRNHLEIYNLSLPSTRNRT